MIDSEQVSKEPRDLLDGFEWVTMDLTNEEEVQSIALKNEMDTDSKHS